MTRVTTELSGGLRLTVDRAKVEGDDSAPTNPLLLLAAMGVPADYYDPFVAGLTALGHNVVRVHWRDEDRAFPPANKRYGYAVMSETDVPAAARWTREEFGADPILVGHSLGGHVALLSAALGGPYRGAAIITSGTNYWRLYRLRHKLGLLFSCLLLIPLSVKRAGFWPGGRFDFGGLQTAQVMLDWARLGVTGRFEPRGAQIGHEAALRKLELPILSMAVEGDKLIAPFATQHLLEKIPRCEIRSTTWSAPERQHSGHFRWAKAPSGPAEVIDAWASGLTPAEVA